MNIWTVVIILLIAAILLFLWSLFAVDKPSELEQEVDETTGDLYREIAKLNKRIDTLEEMLANDAVLEQSDNVPNVVEQEVISYYAKGFTMEEIADDLNIPDIVVKETVTKYIES